MIPARFNQTLHMSRLPQHESDFLEIKDPSILQITPTRFLMYASIGNSINQQWKVGRFEATDPRGPWQELESVEFRGISGPQLCAPAVMLEDINGQLTYTMYIQTACFEEDGVIAYATSEDGHIFNGQPQPLISRQTLINPPYPVVGVYDVAVSDVHSQEDILQCMLYSGYRKIGCGDIYLSTKKKGETQWSAGECILTQEEVPFHNHPHYEHYEWGLEGAKIVQLDDYHYLLIGVCFNPKPHDFAGTRQRVFMAAAPTIKGPFTLLGTPFNPSSNEGKSGENGHPDTLIVEDALWVIYQERDGFDKPWYLRIAKYPLAEMTAHLHTVMNGSLDTSPIPTQMSHATSMGNA